MGTWGPRIFEDDFALDVREEFLALLLRGRSAEQATTDLLGDGRLDVDEEPIFWLSLAATQWEYSQLVPRVKKEALRVIDTDTDLARWKPDEAKRAREWGSWSEVHIVQRLETVLAGRRWVDEGRAKARRLRAQSTADGSRGVG